MKKLLLLVLFCLFLCGCDSSKGFNKDFPYMRDTEHIYVKESFDDVYEIFEQGTGVILLAFNANQYECPYCKVCIPLLNEVALTTECNQIYYLDIYEMRTNETSSYQQLLNYIEDEVGDLEIRDNKKTLVVPDVYFVKKGNILSHHISTIKNENGEGYKTSLSKEEEESLKQIYREGFNSLGY